MNTVRGFIVRECVRNGAADRVYASVGRKKQAICL